MMQCGKSFGREIQMMGWRNKNKCWQRDWVACRPAFGVQKPVQNFWPGLTMHSAIKTHPSKFPIFSQVGVLLIQAGLGYDHEASSRLVSRRPGDRTYWSWLGRRRLFFDGWGSGLSNACGKSNLKTHLFKSRFFSQAGLGYDHEASLRLVSLKPGDRTYWSGLGWRLD